MRAGRIDGIQEWQCTGILQKTGCLLSLEMKAMEAMEGSSCASGFY